MTRAGRRSWADNATAERREAGLPVCAGGPTPRKRGVARHLRDTYKAVTSLGAPPIPSGVGSDEGEKRKEKNPDAKRAGGEETGLFDIVNRKRRGAMHRRDAGAPSRQRQRTRSRLSARLGTPSRRHAGARAVLPCWSSTRGSAPCRHPIRFTTSSWRDGAAHRWSRRITTTSQR